MLKGTPETVLRMRIRIQSDTDPVRSGLFGSLGSGKKLIWIRILYSQKYPCVYNFVSLGEAETYRPTERTQNNHELYSRTIFRYE